MATQLKLDTEGELANTGTDIPGEGEGQEQQQAVERDFEAEAREHGWVPKEDFKGDASRWVDAETFMKRADDMMPLLKAQNARLKRDLDGMKRDLKKATAHFEGAEKRAYERALADIEARIEAATEEGDLAATRAALDDLKKLKPADSEAPKHSQEEAQEAFDEWREANPWYDRANLANASEIVIDARLYADRMVDKHIGKTKDMAPAEFFDMIAGMVHEKYPALKNGTAAARQKPQSPVEGGGHGRGRSNAQSWDNLPEEAKRQFTRFIDRGLLGVKETGDKAADIEASKKYYARTFDWKGYQA